MRTDCSLSCVSESTNSRSREVIISFCLALVRPHVEYSFVPCSTGHTGKLEQVQRKPIKIPKGLTQEMKGIMRELGLFSLEKKRSPLL